MIKRMRNGLLILSTAILVLVLLFALLVSNRSFNHWLVAQLVEQVAELQVVKTEGLLLNGLQLTGVSYQTEQLSIDIKSLAYQFSWLDLLAARIHFKSLQVKDVEVLLHEIEAQEDEAGPVKFIMPLPLQIENISLQKLTIKQAESSYAIDNIGLALSYQGQQVQLSRIALKSGSLQLKAKADLQIGEGFPFKADLELVKSIPELADLKAQVSAYGDSQKIYLSAQVLAPQKIQTQGWIQFSDATTSFDLQADWLALQWPLQGDKQYASENAHLTLQGSLEQYFLTLNSSVRVNDLPAAQLSLQGQGDAEQITLKTLDINSPSGDIQSKGLISWTEGIPSDIQLQANQIQLAAIVPGYSGELSLDARLSGQLFNQPDLQLDIENVKGNVLGKKLLGIAKVHYAAETTIEQFLVSVGTNVINFQGKLGTVNALDFKLNAQNLHELSPDLSGSVFAHGSLKGDIDQPFVEFKLESQDLKFQDQQIASIQSSGTLDTSHAGRLDMQFIARQLVFNGQKIDKVELQSIGQNAHHELRAQVFAEQAELKLAMQGAWHPVDKTWNGQLQHMQLQAGSSGLWRIIQASPLAVAFTDQQSMQLDTEFCLAQKNATGLICIDAQTESTGRQLNGTIKQLPLAVFAYWMPATVKVNSLLNGDFSLSLQDALLGNVQLSLDPGALIVQDEELGVQRLDFKVAEFNAQLLVDTLQSDLAFRIDDTNQISGQIEALGLTNIATARINGLLNVSLEKVAFLSAFVDSVSNITGKINGEVYLQGLLKSPDLNKSWLQLQQGSLTVVDAGLSVRDANLEVKHTRAEQIAVLGDADIEGQKISLKGQIDQYSNENMQFKLDIKGEDLPLLQLPEMQAWLSPDLRLSGNIHSANLQGNIQVPKAIMIFHTLPESAVQLSNDEVIVNDQKEAVKQSGYPMDMDVIIKLGKAVSIEGFGLKTRLGGALRATQKGNDLKLFNELNFLQGTYAAYGQDLTIEKGQFLFAGNIENPGISILASRKASDWDDKTIAYLKMTGTLKKPITRIYTEPALNDSEALAYLLTGAPLGKGDSDSAGLIAKAALSLGRDYVDAVMGTVGVDEFDIKSTHVGQNSMIVGKRITPRLYARYIMDILTTQMQFAVEYKLTENISIETRAGSTHSSDIKYSIEFD